MSTEASQGDAAEPKIIKRYSNRKLYDTEASKYVTLDEIARMVKAGDELRIIDNETKEDLTSVTLTQIIYEEEKRESRMPLSMLRNLIQTRGNTLQEFFDRSVRGPALELRGSVEKNIEDLTQGAAQIRDVASRNLSEIGVSARRLLDREERRAAGFKRNFTHLLDQLDERLLERLKDIQQAKDSHETVEASLAERMHIEEHLELLRSRLAATEKNLQQLQDATEPESSGPDKSL